MSNVVLSQREAVDDAVALEKLAYQLESSGQDMLAVRQMERALLVRCREGVDEQCISAAERLVVKCNTVAVKSFKSDDYSNAVMLLDNALRLTDDNSQPLSTCDEKRWRLRGTTLNNYGCLERRRGRLPASLRFLELSLQFGGQQSPATFLNISAIQSQLGMHDEAVGSARRAIGLLEQSNDATGLLAIAYHNLAMALETTNTGACVQAYEKALHLAQKDLGEASPTFQAIEKNLGRYRQRNKINRPVSLPPIQPERPMTSPVHPFSVAFQRGNSSNKRSDSPKTPEKGKGKAPSGDRHEVAPPRPALRPQPPEKPNVRRSRTEAVPLEPLPQKREEVKSQVSQQQLPPTPQKIVKKPTKPQTREKEKSPPAVADTAPATSASTTSATANPVQATAAAAEKPLQEQDIPTHRSEDLVAFMVNRLNVLLGAEEQFETIFSQVVKIQTLFRCFSARKRMRQRLAERKRLERLHEITMRSAGKKILKFLRRIVTLNKVRNTILASQQIERERRSLSAIRIQKMVRCWLARRKVFKLRTFKRRSTKAVLKIQCWFRKLLSRKARLAFEKIRSSRLAQLLVEEKRSHAAVQIQKVWRGYRANDEISERRGVASAARERDRKSRQIVSAVRIQSWWRGALAQRRFNSTVASKVLRRTKLRAIERRIAATTVLQAFGRGIAVRRKTSVLLRMAREAKAVKTARSRTLAATMIQKHIRKYLASKRVARMVQLRKDNKLRARLKFVTTFLERFFSGFAARLLVGRLRDVKVSQQRRNIATTLDVLPNVEKPSMNTKIEAKEAVQVVVVASDVGSPLISCKATSVTEERPSDQSPSQSQPITDTTSQIEALVGSNLQTETTPTAAIPEQGDLQHASHHNTPQSHEVNKEWLVSSPMRAVATDNGNAVDSTTLEQSHPASTEPKVTCEPESVAKVEAVVVVATDLVVHPETKKSTEQQCHKEAETRQRHPQCTPSPSVEDDRIEFQKRRLARLTESQKSAGAVLVRVGKGFLARLYVRAVRGLVSDYINDLTSKHSESPTKPVRQLTFSLLDKLAEEVKPFKKDLTMRQPQSSMSSSEAATRIQCAVRVLLAKRRVARLRHAKLEKWEKINEAAQAAAALTIQRNVRMHQAKGKAETLRNENNLRWEAMRKAEENSEDAQM